MEKEEESQSTIRYTRFEQSVLSGSLKLYDRHRGLLGGFLFPSGRFTESEFGFWLFLYAIMMVLLINELIDDYVRGNTLLILLDNIALILFMSSVADLTLKYKGKPGLLHRLRKYFREPKWVSRARKV